MKKIIFALVVVSLLGCKGAEEALSDLRDQLPSPDEHGLRNPDTKLANGEWDGGCEDKTSAGSPYGYSWEITNNNGNANFDMHSFSNGNCSGQANSRHTIKYLFGVTAKSSLGSDIYEVDMKVTNYEMVALTQAEADLRNQISMCGFTNWTVGVGKDVTNNTCITSSIPMGEWGYTIAKYTTTQMQFGKNSTGKDGKTPETRHTELDSKIFTKK